MIEYVFPDNPDDRVLNRARDLLSSGDIIVIPTDTNWVMVADLHNKNGVEKIYRAKGEDKTHHFSLLVNGLSIASEYAFISDRAFRLLKGKIPGHYTFIFGALKKTTKLLKASKTDHQVGLRFVPNTLVSRLVDRMSGPLISTNIDPVIFGKESGSDPIYSYEIEEKLKGHVSMIIDPGEYEFVGPSTIYDLSGEEFELMREGSGKLF